MQFQAGARVELANGDSIGRLARVVVDPRTKEVTHLIVEKGLLLKTDKVIPMELVTGADRERIRLREDLRSFDDLPDYMEEHYIMTDEREWVANPDAAATTDPVGPSVNINPPSVLYWYPPSALGFPSYSPGVPLSFHREAEPGYQVETERNIPEETVPLKEGAKVIAADGQHVGNIERVFTDREQRVTHLLISQGLFLKQRKVVPVEWVLDIGEDDVRLAVGSNLLQGLRDYHEERDR